MNYFYYDQANQKQGPVSEQQLNELAVKGVIGLHTPLETEGGHKGVAGQIPGLFPATSQSARAIPPYPQVFCTNCGSPVFAQAVGCMSCGVKPTGHKKFCRYCGAALGELVPGQVICTKCGASLATGYMGGAKRVIQSFVSTSVGKITSVFKLVIGAAVAIGLVWFLYIFALPLLMPSDPLLAVVKNLQNAQSGDSVKYDIAISTNGEVEKGTFAYKVISNDGKKIKVKTMDTPPGGSRENEREIEVDLSKLLKCRSYVDFIQYVIEQGDVPIEMKQFLERVVRDVDVKIKGGSTGKATVSMAGSSFSCIVTPYIVTANVGSTSFSIRDIMIWTSPKVPITGVVKAEWETTFPILGNYPYHKGYNILDDYRNRTSSPSFVKTSMTVGITVTLTEYSSSR